MGVLKVKTGGNWVDVISSADEVYVGPSQPTDPSTELWYDTDAGSTYTGIPPGGSASQVLAKKSGSDYDVEWIANPSRIYTSNANRDAQWPAATAGAGAQSYTTDKQRLWISDGTTWKLFGGSFPRCKAQKLSVQTVSGGAPITWPEAEIYDTDNIHDTTTNNSRMTIPPGLGGLWLFSAFLYLPPAAATSEMYLMKNGAAERWAWLKLASTATEDIAIDISAIIPCNATDYVEVQASSSASRSYGHVALPGYFAATYTGAL